MAAVPGRTPHYACAVDRIVLTVPRDPDQLAVVRLVVGGLAARLELPFEAMDDLQLAVEALLGALDRGLEQAVITVDVADDELAILIGPYGDAVRAQILEADGDRAATLGLGRLLDTLVDRVDGIDRDGTTWLELRKRRVGLPPAHDSARA